MRMEVWRCSHSAARQVILVIFSDPNFVSYIRLSKIFMFLHLSKKEELFGLLEKKTTTTTLRSPSHILSPAIVKATRGQMIGVSICSPGNQTCGCCAHPPTASDEVSHSG